MRLRSSYVRVFAVVFTLLVSIQAWSQQKPKLQTEKGRYQSGETAKIKGSGWAAGENVTATVRGAGSDITVYATADAKGEFTVPFVVPEVEATAEAAGVMLKITAEGAISGESEFLVTAGPDLGYAGDRDPDLPAFKQAREVDKQQYLEDRELASSQLRGLHKDKERPEPGARGRAIREMNRKEGRSEKKISTASGSANLSSEEGLAPSPTGTFSSSDPISGLAGSVGPRWASIGPAPLFNGQTFGVSTPVSGRVTSVALHPTNANIAYVGTAQGGVYRTLDGGATWTAMMDNADTLAVGAVAIAPSQPSTIYIGTGEGNFSGDTFFGVGVYRIDNADTSNPEVTGPLNKNLAGADVLSGWSINKVIVHPTDPNIIFVGTATGVGGASGSNLNDATAASLKPRGLFRSNNATSDDARFMRLNVATDNGGNLSITDIEFDPANPSTVFTTVRGTSAAGAGGVYRSYDALSASPTFTRVLAVANASALVRAEIAVARSGDSLIIFAATSDGNGTVRRSIDGGNTWSAPIASVQGYCNPQCSYDMPIAVNPANPNFVAVGGAGDGPGIVGMFARSFNALSDTPTFSESQQGLHADVHAIEFFPANPNIIWHGNDGGIWKSFDLGTNWASLNKIGFNATQFTGLALHPTDQYFTIGGTQDNGTEWQKPDNTWIRADFGDGGFAAIDQTAPNNTNVIMYHTYFNQTNNLIGFGRVTNVANATDGGWTFIGCNGTTSNNNMVCSDTVNFYAPITLGPGATGAINTFYFGTSRLYRSTGGGANMAQASQVFNPAVPIASIGISRQNDNVRIVGLNNGKVYRTMTGANPMDDVTGPLPAAYVSRAVIDPNNVNVAYVTYSAFFNNATHHVWKTTNLNDAVPTWTPAGNGIPDVPVSAFAVDPADSNDLYAGTDIGVFHSSDGGANWVPYSNGLPRVAVFDMAIHPIHRILRIATHGRGMWEISVGATGNLSGVITDAATSLPIAGATVLATKNAATSSATTDANGAYSFTGIAVGSYNVVASTPGYSANSATTSVTAATPAVVNLALTAAATSACRLDTTRPDFEAGSGINVDTAISPGDVHLPSSNIVDQAQGNTTSQGSAITNTVWQAQTFTAGMTGNLARIDVSLFCAGCTNPAVLPTVTLELRDVVGGQPGPNVLATSSIPAFSSGSSSIKQFAFAVPPAVTAGTQYAWLVRLPVANPLGTYAILRSPANAYPNGVVFQSTNSGGAWTAQTWDWVFQTVMTSRRYVTTGDLTSSLKDANPAPGSLVSWGSLAWSATTPAGTSIKFHVAASNTANGAFHFVGPDGTANTYFTSNFSSLSQFNGNRFLKYKAYLSTTNDSVTPALHDVTICFTDIAPSNLSVANVTGTFGGSVSLTATLTSRGNGVAGKPVTFTLNGANVGTSATDSVGVAALHNVSLAGLNTGSYPIVASYAGDNEYQPSTGNGTLSIGKADQAISFGTLENKTIGSADFNVSATSTSGLPVSFAATGACTVTGSTVHLTGVGSCSIIASQSGNDNWNAAPSITQTFQVMYAGCLLFDNTKAKNAGSTVPVKLALCDSNGTNLSSAGTTVTAVSLRQVSTSASGVVEDSGSANPDNNFRFTVETGASFYIFNLSTKGLSVGTWELTYRASGDNTDHKLTFQLR